jgi:hypothetical protein
MWIINYSRQSDSLKNKQILFRGIFGKKTNILKGQTTCASFTMLTQGKCKIFAKF